MGGFQSDFSPPKLRGVSNFLLLFCAILGTNLQNRHFRRVCILFKNGHSEGSPTVGELHFDSRPPQLRGVPKFPLLRFRDFWKLIFRIVASRESHFGLKRPFRGAHALGGFQFDSRPSKLRGVSKSPFSAFRDFGG